MAALDIDLFDMPARARIEALQWDLTAELLAGGTTVIIEWGVWSRHERDELREPGPLFKITSGMLYAASFSFVSLGIARGALDAFINDAIKKVPRGGQKTIAHNNVIQAEVAKCEAKLRTSRAFVLECLGALWEEAERGNRSTAENSPKMSPADISVKITSRPPSV